MMLLLPCTVYVVAHGGPPTFGPTTRESQSSKRAAHPPTAGSRARGGHHGRDQRPTRKERHVAFLGGARRETANRLVGFSFYTRGRRAGGEDLFGSPVGVHFFTPGSYVLSWGK
jgi:hypothetical protein